MGLHFVFVDLGMIEILEEITLEQRNQLKLNLLTYGLELLEDNRKILIDKVKNVIIEMIHYSDEFPKVNYSDYISQQLGYDYTYLSNIFPKLKGLQFNSLS